VVRQPLPGVVPRRYTGGGFVVVEVVHKSELGFFGSRNTLEYVAAGANGMVTDSGCRDIEELVRQGFPVHSAYISPQPGRIELDETGVPVRVGGVNVRPSDLVVADASGVVVVPAEHVHEVADIAHDVRSEDRGARGDLYAELGLEEDGSVS
jgi:regulator of RNase E activity RraA